jgi:nucleoside-diphosphate-sugar epimerase
LLETKNIQDVRNYKVSNEKAKMELDFKPRFTPADTVMSILKNVDKNVDFSDKSYYNIQTFKESF